MKNLIFFCLFLSSGSLFAQNILDNKNIQEKVENCLYSTYSFDFEVAINLQNELKELLPRHPVTYFLEGLIYYWKYFPLLPDAPEVAGFENAMNKAVSLSEEMLKGDPGNIEGVFFDMHARAFKAMFWADNGKPARVLSDLDNMYRQTMKGIELKHVFPDFYFSSGLYNYYVEAYVERHPIYKPVAALFRKGDKTQGLKELDYATKNTVYIKYEAYLFMSLLYLNYENDPVKSLEYLTILYNNFPDNKYFRAQYLVVLLHSRHFDLAEPICDNLRNSNNDFDLMLHYLSRGFLLEIRDNQATQAKWLYKKVLEHAEELGNIADLYAAIAEAGLSRIAEGNENEKSARKHRKKSEEYVSYDFILDFK